MPTAELTELRTRLAEGDELAGCGCSNQRSLIDNVITSLQNTATEAGAAVSNFTNGVQNQVESFQQGLVSEVNNIQQNIQEAVSNVTSGVTSLTSGISNCIVNAQQQSQNALNEAVHEIATCADNVIGIVVDEIASLVIITEYAAEAANDIREKVKSCGNSSTDDIFSLGACLGATLWETKVKAVTVTVQSTLLIARINLSLMTLTASLNDCITSEIPQVTATVSQVTQNLAQCWTMTGSN